MDQNNYYLRGRPATTSPTTTEESLASSVVNNEATTSSSRTLVNDVVLNDAVMNYFANEYISESAAAEANNNITATNQGGANLHDSFFEKVVTGPFKGQREIPLLLNHNNNNNDPFVPPLIVHNNEKIIRIEDRVIGGQNVVQNEKHYAILLYWDTVTSEWKWAGCGATLVSACHVVTAGHCLEGGVEIGGVFLNAIAPYHDNNGRPFHFSFVANSWMHPDYDDFTNRADISVLKLQDCVDASSSSQEYPYAIPATPSYQITSGTNTEVFGFGRMSDSDETLPEVLQHATVPFIDRNDCQDRFYGRSVLDDMVCAGFEQGGTDACQGDSGSGLIRREANGDITHLGIVSWGVGCGRAGSPGVYIDVSYYYNWLHDDIICSDVDAKASWCDPRTVGYSPRPVVVSNNGGAGVNVPTPPTPAPVPTPTPPTTTTNSYVNAFCNLPGMSCLWNTDCCSGVCVMDAENYAGDGAIESVCARW